MMNYEQLTRWNSMMTSKNQDIKMRKSDYFNKKLLIDSYCNPIGNVTMHNLYTFPVNK